MSLQKYLCLPLWSVTPNQTFFSSSLSICPLLCLSGTDKTIGSFFFLSNSTTHILTKRSKPCILHWQIPESLLRSPHLAHLRHLSLFISRSIQSVPVPL